MQLLRLLPLLVLIFAAPFPALAQSSQVMLLQGGRQEDGSYLLGLSVKLAPGWMTYWRYPGEVGVPPKISIEGSENIKDLKMDFPAPKLFYEGEFTVLGYEGEVIFPLHAVPERANEPLNLHLTFSYGVCEKICVPETRKFEEILREDGVAGDAEKIMQASARVPQPRNDLGSLGLTREWPQQAMFTFAKKEAYDFAVFEAEEKLIFSVAKPVQVNNKQTVSFPGASLPKGTWRVSLTFVTGNRAATTTQNLAVR